MDEKIELHNDQTVFILGAGFSAARGLPLIGNFAIRMRDAAIWCEDNRRDDEAKSIYEVLKFRLDAAAAAYRVAIDLENIEELFSLASAGSPEIADHVRRAIAATINYCAQNEAEPIVRFSFAQQSDLQFLSSEMPGNSGSAKLYPVIVKRLMRGGNPKRASFITFNYDLVLEEALKILGIDWDYVPALGQDPSSRARIPLLKMHGSINWARASDDDSGLKVHDTYEELRKSGEFPELVPPTWNKIVHSGLAGIWAAAVEILSKATTIVIVGFSMPRTDLHFKYLLAAGMRQNISLRDVVFVDPGNSVKERASEVFAAREISNSRVRFVEASFESLVASGSSSPYTLVPSFSRRY